MILFLLIVAISYFLSTPKRQLAIFIVHLVYVALKHLRASI